MAKLPAEVRLVVQFDPKLNRVLFLLLVQLWKVKTEDKKVTVSSMGDAGKQMEA